MPVEPTPHPVSVVLRSELLAHHQRILVGVSGGGDSMALMHLLADQFPNKDIVVATVDHGLRPEAAEEAEFVAKEAASLGLPHTVLNWQQESRNAQGVSGQSARLARHELLTLHAAKVGATAVALAHTMDDQAETVIMRAMRARPHSALRGLSAIADVTTHALNPASSVQFIRPLLATSRDELRAWLKARAINWVEDPTNDDISNERIAIRRALATGLVFPATHHVAKLANLSARGRHWLNLQSAAWIDGAVHIESEGTIRLEHLAAPAAVVANALATLICVAGGQQRRPARSKIAPVLRDFLSAKPSNHTVGRALVCITSNGATLTREKRGKEAKPSPEHGKQGLLDGRLWVDEDGKTSPFIAALERFRPACDDTLYESIAAKLNPKNTPTGRLKQRQPDLHST